MPSRWKIKSHRIPSSGRETGVYWQEKAYVLNLCTVYICEEAARDIAAFSTMEQHPISAEERMTGEILARNGHQSTTKLALTCNTIFKNDGKARTVKAAVVGADFPSIST